MQGKDEDTDEYIAELRKSVLEAWVGIFQGWNNNQGSGRLGECKLLLIMSFVLLLFCTILPSLPPRSHYKYYMFSIHFTRFPSSHIAHTIQYPPPPLLLCYDYYRVLISFAALPASPRPSITVLLFPRTNCIRCSARLSTSPQPCWRPTSPAYCTTSRSGPANSSRRRMRRRGTRRCSPTWTR